MTSSDQKKRARTILRRLRKHYPDAEPGRTSLPPFQVLVTVILSAQCTDVAVARVTPALFKRWPDARAFAKAPQRSIEAMIRSLGLFRAKAKSIRAASRMLLEEFSGKVPRTMAELTRLPGVGRKTANVVLPRVFGVPGLAVDTHVVRLSGRLGLSKHDDPAKIESDLCALFPPKSWDVASHSIIFHGRRICPARTPRCVDCFLSDLCPSVSI